MPAPEAGPLARALTLRISRLGICALLVLPGCSMFKPKPPGDPIRMSESELDVAGDLWWRQNQPREALKHALRATELDPKMIF